MFARCNHVRLKAAHKALDQGRLDDAVQAARDLAQWDDPRRAQLVAALARPLVARARLHRQSGQYAAALADLDQLVALGSTDSEALALRSELSREHQQRAGQSAAQVAATHEAEAQIRAGRLESGRLQIERVADAEARAQLAHELDIRERRTAELLKAAQAALDSGDVMLALRLWRDAGERHGQTVDTQRVARALVEPLRKHLATMHREGRLDALLASRAAVDRLADIEPTLSEVRRLIDLVGRAAAELCARNYAGLRRTLLRVRAAQADAGWVGSALDALARINAGEEALLASPLGLHAGAPAPSLVATEAPRVARAAAFVDPAALSLERSLLVLVDGGSSALLIARDQVRIGRGGRQPVDVALPGELEPQHAQILRREDDYFLVAFGPTDVNRRRVSQAMLRDGDRVDFGGAARFTFHKPSSRSPSAVLRLSHRCRLPEDVSEIVLFRETCLIGPSAHCHIRTRDAADQVVLYDVGGRLHARLTTGDDALAASALGLHDGATRELGTLRLTVKNYAIV